MEAAKEGSIKVGSKFKGIYKILASIAGTEQAEVFKAQAQGGELVAIKVYNLAKLQQDQYWQSKEAYIKKEVDLVKGLNHPNIVRYRDHSLTKTEAVLVQEYCDGGDLAEVLKNRKKPFSEEEVKLLLYYMLKAMTEVSRRKIVHRDIKPENIFLKSLLTVPKEGPKTGEPLLDFIAKIGDFGIAREEAKDIRSFVGTDITMAPEVVLAQNYGTACDIWSLGVTIFILQTGRDPWFRHDYLTGKSEEFAKVPDYEKPNLFKANGDNLPFSWPKFPHMNYDNKISDIMKKIYRAMLRLDPKQRPSWAEILKMLGHSPKGQEELSVIQTHLMTIKIPSSVEQSLIVSSPVSFTESTMPKVKTTAADYFIHMESVTNWMFHTGIALSHLHEDIANPYTAAFEVLSAVVLKLAQSLLAKLVDKTANEANATAIQTDFGNFYKQDGGVTLDRLLNTQEQFRVEISNQINTACMAVRRHWDRCVNLDTQLLGKPDTEYLVRMGMAFGRVASDMILTGVDAGFVEVERLQLARQRLFDAYVCLNFETEFKFRDSLQKVFDWESFGKNQPTASQLDQMFETVYCFFENQKTDNDPQIREEQFYTG